MLRCTIVPARPDTRGLARQRVYQEYVTSLIHHCYEVALEAHDIRAMQMLDYFVKEQGEEEADARDMINNMKLFGSDPKPVRP